MCARLKAIALEDGRGGKGRNGGRKGLGGDIVFCLCVK